MSFEGFKMNVAVLRVTRKQGVCNEINFMCGENILPVEDLVEGYQTVWNHCSESFSFMTHHRSPFASSCFES